MTTFAHRAIGALVVLSAGLCVYAVRQADPDLFGYLVYGRLFVQPGGVIDLDPFAYTSSGFHWVTFEYLSQISLWRAYDFLGPAGLIALKCLLGGGAVYFLSIAVRATTDDPIVWVPVFLLCTSTASRYFLFRPQLFTFLFFALFVAVLFRFMVLGKAPLWVLPLVMLVWANTHGGFLAGLGAIALVTLIRVCGNLNDGSFGVRAAVKGTRPLVLALAACVAVTFLNPRGGQLWEYVLTEIFHDTNRRYIAEWQPAGFGADPWSATALTFITVVLVGVGWIAQRGRRSVADVAPWQWVTSCTPVIAMAYLSVRHVPIAAIWTAPVITLLCSAIKRSAHASVLAPAWLAISSCALVPVFLTMGYVGEHPWPVIATDGRVLGDKHPCRVVAFMRENTLRGNVFNPLWWGSYITWEAYPAIRVSMDGRNISLFPGEMVAENLRFYSPDVTPADLDAPLRYQTDFLLVPEDRPVLNMLRSDARWQQIYADTHSRLFVRADPAHQPLLSSVKTFAMPDDSCPQVLARAGSRP